MGFGNWEGGKSEEDDSEANKRVSGERYRPIKCLAKRKQKVKLREKKKGTRVYVQRIKKMVPLKPNHNLHSHRARLEIKKKTTKHKHIPSTLKKLHTFIYLCVYYIKRERGGWLKKEKKRKKRDGKMKMKGRIGGDSRDHYYRPVFCMFMGVSGRCSHSESQTPFPLSSTTHSPTHIISYIV